MAWEQELFDYLDDLEGQAAARYAAERATELAERSREEYRSVALAGRLMASLDHEVTLELAGLGALSGRLVRVATGWCLLRGPGQDWVVRLAAVAAVHGASERAVPELAWPPTAVLGLGSALRRLADTAEPCSLHLTDGRSHTGTIQRVGADFVEVAAGEPARVVLVAIDHLAAVGSHV